MIQSGVGYSQHRNPQTAANEAYDKALAQAGISSADFLFVFATIGYNQQQLIDTIRLISKKTPLSGCSAEGVIANGVADEDNFALVIMAIKSDQIEFTCGLTSNLKKAPYEAGQNIGHNALNQKSSSRDLALFLYPDGINVNWDALKAGIQDAQENGGNIPIFGAAAGDNWKFKEAYQYCNDEVTTDGVSWAVMSGDACLYWGLGHGCVPIGIEHKVTKANKNTIYEIDNRLALDVLKQDYLTDDEITDWAKTFQTFTLGMKEPKLQADYDQFIIRTMTGGVCEEDGSITLATEINVGDSLWVARRDFEKMKNGNRQLLDLIMAKKTDKPFAMAFQFECIGRGKVFVPDDVKHEMIDILRQDIGLDVPWIGFYSFGEIGPVGDQNHFHNESMVLLTIQ